MGLQEQIRTILREETKPGKYISALEDLTEDFKNEDCVCDIKISHKPEEFRDTYLINVKVGNRDLDDKFNGVDYRIRNYLNRLRRNITDEVLEFIPIPFFVIFSDTPNCSAYRNLNESENLIPLPIRRRISSDDLEEAFHYALEQNAISMTNPNSIIFKDKEHTTLEIFSKFVIDDMITVIEQEFFNDDNRIYFSDIDSDNDYDYYHEKIRKPLLKHYKDRMKEKFQEVKSEDINESTFFRRRVDMSLMEKEFFDILNMLTDIYISKYNEDVDFSFDDFESHVIDYFIDNYYHDLTDGGENDYPHDEIHEFLLNHFHDKIKDRYDSVFNRNTNKSENKKQSRLLSKIEEDGLYQIMQDTGLSLSQIRSKIGEPSREVFEGYIKDFIFNEGNHRANGPIQMGYELELPGGKYINSFYMDGDTINVELYDTPSSGSMERLSNLSDEEIIKIAEGMIYHYG